MHLVHSPHPFSQSRIWQLQRDYFSGAGIEAWRSGEVPHYVTSNPVVGKAYAELVLAFLRDLALKGQTEEKVYLLELGAGHGRLCYHFFKHFEKYYSQSAIPLPPFCYVLSDFTEATLEFWRDHSRLQPYLGKGWLDFALFDAEKSEEIVLEHSGQTLAAGALSQPLILIGNYFFDTIPQELFWVEDQRIAQSLLSLSCEKDPEQLSIAALLHELLLHYEYEEVQPPLYPEEPQLNQVMELYRQELSHTHVLFPHIGLRCLERLRQLSQQGLLLLTADKGHHRLEDLKDRAAPLLATHGSFSLTVNYHAFRHYAAQLGGISFFPRHQQANLDLGCLLLLPQAESYQETLNAYDRFVNDYGPDDYFSLKKLIEQHFATMSLRDIMSTLRLSGYDARIFLQMQPCLMEVLPEITDNERWSLFQAIHRVWDTYFPLGEDADLAFELANLLFALNFYKEAIIYFELSIKVYGQTQGTRFNIALCYCLMESFPEAKAIIDGLLVEEPDSPTLLKLIQAYEQELAGVEV